MAYQSEDRDGLLITPPGRHFVMSGALWHIALDSTITSAEHTDQYSAVLLCTGQVSNIRAQTVRAYESEVCPACSLK